MKKKVAALVAAQAAIDPILIWLSIALKECQAGKEKRIVLCRLLVDNDLEVHKLRSSHIA